MKQISMKKRKEKLVENELNGQPGLRQKHGPG